MTTNVSFRPQVSLAPTVTQQSDANNYKAALNQLKADYNNNQVSDIAAMTQQTDLESKLQETKAEPVKYVEDVKTNKPSDSNSVEQSKVVTDPAFEKTVKNLQSGKQYSLNEREQMLTSQMNQMAMNNRILHGLF
ncbi:MAG: hypothetical protein NC200_01270 [Candidatus Gastranaerophilales bacterium]|nr:hypothetical protein [Candidatus Gastranaerophilales bacterium]